MPNIAQSATAQASAPAGTGATTIINASGINFRYRDLVSLTITTPNAAAAVLTVSDGSKSYLLNYPNAAAAPGSPLQVSFDPPLQQSGNGNAAWTITPSVNASGFNVTAQFIER